MNSEIRNQKSEMRSQAGRQVGPPEARAGGQMAAGATDVEEQGKRQMANGKSQNCRARSGHWLSALGTLVGAFLIAVLVCSLFPVPYSLKAAAPPANVQPRPTGVIVDTPTITIAGASATTTATPTSSAHEAQIQWNFGTVSGTYSTCTVQLKTSFDGTNWLTLGAAASVTVTSNTLNAWTVIEQLGTTSVTTTTPSSSAAAGFGELTEAVFSCSTYGASAPVTISVVYR